MIQKTYFGYFRNLVHTFSIKMKVFIKLYKSEKQKEKGREKKFILRPWQS